MRISICIPNYNYEGYLDKTLNSVLASSYRNFEILISDNASTDGSVALVKKYMEKYPLISLHCNAANLGFAGNLDVSGAMAQGDYMIMLSSDDLIAPEALEIYSSLIEKNPGTVIGSSWDIISSHGEKIGYTGPNKAIWKDDDLDQNLSKQLGVSVFRIKAPVLLRRCLSNMATPFNFCTVAYKREWYERIGGYGGGRLINPDKWFHWKLLTVADDAVFIDKPLFQYRWHAQNQTSLQARTGTLKYMIDEYRNTIEVTDQMLKDAQVSRKQLGRNFINRDVYRHGVGEFLKGRWLKSLRIFFFGLSTFPGTMLSSGYLLPYILMLLTTPIGAKICSLFFGREWKGQ